MIADDLFSLLEAAPCGAYVVSVDQTILFWNSNAERILGYTSDDALGRRCYDIVSGRSSTGLTPECLGGCLSIRYLRAGIAPAPLRLEMLCASGERKWVTVTPMVVAGVFMHAPVMVHLFREEPGDAGAVQGEASSLESLIRGGADILSELQPTETPTLTPRELEVLRLVAGGLETPLIAGELDFSPHTVRNHIRNLRHKLLTPPPSWTRWSRPYAWVSLGRGSGLNLADCAVNRESRFSVVIAAQAP